jgi:hypothetical protein
MRSELVYMLENHLMPEMADVVKRAVDSRNYRLFGDALDLFDDRLLAVGGLHGVTHIERVCFLGLLLCNELDLSEDDAKLVLTAGAFHDIGRLDECEDEEHGLRAAEAVHRYVPCQDENLKIVEAAIEVHSVSDSKMPEIIDKYRIADVGRAERIAKVLKDADGLDRVRTGDLDPEYLRFKESHGLIGFANQLFWYYH